MAGILAEAGVSYVVIGGHAVNCWLEPRLTGDVDLTVAADSRQLEALRTALEKEGFVSMREHGGQAQSGPDFIRFWCASRALVLEVQTAKTAFQREVLSRAIATPDGVRVASVEDLIILKLIADRPKDQADLAGLLGLSALDWPYIEKWSAAWGVLERLERRRGGRS
ncbi:MAG TPA: nucleotidyl transferase AbiEii/AbiGii toxin family protein [Gemmatimonadaceae bacterium]|nr:nucleotidyl transferase AbiEii/AbiGii toxin family protein [Gemmatimonadaceae bacterium]